MDFLSEIQCVNYKLQDAWRVKYEGKVMFICWLSLMTSDDAIKVNINQTSCDFYAEVSL